MSTAVNEFPRGLLRRELFLGIVSAVSATQARLNLSAAEQPSGSHFESSRYGRGEVGELVLIEGQVDLVLARLVDVRVGEPERWDIGRNRPSLPADVSGYAQFLGTVRPDTLRVSAGVASYPRLGDRAYAAPHAFVGRIPRLMAEQDASAIELRIGTVTGNSSAEVVVRPEKLFGRHCAVLGATGGGKSWTVARLLEECLKHRSKLILLDATGEYRCTSGEPIIHCHLGSPLYTAPNSIASSLPPNNFTESDFIAMFEPSGKVQGPKLREAMRSLRLAGIKPELAPDGFLQKARKEKRPIENEIKRHSEKIEDPTCPFDATKLARQVMEECVFPDARNSDPGFWGDYSDSDKSFCLPLATRIHAIVKSPAFRPVFAGEGIKALRETVEPFLSGPHRLLRICLGGVSYEYRAREFIVNAIGRLLLNVARNGGFSDQPALVFVDEAHNFLGQKIGYEEWAIRLDAFEIIAREGRKYGLNVCLATQRPRDLTEGVLSQIGTLIVHRLTNDRDREIVERACGEVDRSASAFLANLRQGEAAVIGVDFPIPMTVKIEAPAQKPLSDGPDYQKAWRADVGPVK
jgi:uncharacterized protein